MSIESAVAARFASGRENGATDMDIITGKLFGVIGKVEHAAHKPCRCMEAEQFCSQYALYFTSISRQTQRQ